MPVDSASPARWSHRVRDSLVLIFALAGCGGATSTWYDDLAITVVGAPVRSQQPLMTVELWFLEGTADCAASEAAFAAGGHWPEVQTLAHTLLDVTDWSSPLVLRVVKSSRPIDAPGAGRVFGTVSVGPVLLATLCSGPMVDGVSAVEAPLAFVHSRPGPELQFARYHHTATELSNGNVVLVGGASNGAGAVPERLDVRGEAVSRLPPLALPRVRHTATLLDTGLMLIAGGQAPATSSASMARTELLDPARGTSTLAADMELPRAFHSAVRLADGRVLVTGGTASGDTFAQAELFDPQIGRWVATGAMATPRILHTSTLLPDGKVLVAGGLTASGDTELTELYNPRDGTFSEGPPMAAPRSRHVAVVLGDGRVLFAGGRYAPEAEVFDPVTNSFAAAGELSAAEDDPCAARLTSGDVALVGQRQVVHVYSQSSNTWSEPALMTRARRGCAAWAHPEGGLVVTGGDDNGAVSSTELVMP